MSRCRAEPVSKLGIPVTLMPAIVLEPSFALTSEEVGEKFKGGKISSRSTLVVDGAGVQIEDLELDGALVIKVRRENPSHCRSTKHHS